MSEVINPESQVIGKNIMRFRFSDSEPTPKRGMENPCDATFGADSVAAVNRAMVLAVVQSEAVNGNA